MKDTAVAGGLMAHQKDEHDIWVCKDCGWKYPNAKPSPKIRKNHKKHCPGKAGADDHHTGGSSDDASDDEHHASVKGSESTHNAATDGPVESKSRSFDFSAASASAKEDVAAETPPPGAAVNGNGKEVQDEAPKPAIAEKEVEVEAKETAASSPSGLMTHQKDEHDVWICKNCGWKYPNAKPSAKVRKHHKKLCAGRGGGEREAVGGSSDEASDDELHSGHHFHHRPPPAAQTTAVAMSEGAENGSADTAPAEAPPNTTREIDFGALKEESAAVEAAPRGADPAVATTTGSTGFMLHQKDEHDIWTCKNCGWKYPNAKPSAKVRKHHKKHCPGKGRQGEDAPGGSSDEASDDEHHSGHHHHPSPAAPTAAAAVSEGAETGSAATASAETSVKAPANNSREIDFGALKKEGAATEATPTSAAAAPDSIETQNSSSTSPPASNKLAELENSGPEESGEVPESVTEREGGSTEIKSDVQPEVSERAKATPKETPIKERELSVGTSGHESTVVGGLLPHQKDAHDIWICRACGWKYPNAKPSSKVRKHHKKICPGKAPGVTGANHGASSDEASDDEYELPSPSLAAPVGTPVEAEMSPEEMPPGLDSGKSYPSGSPEVDETMTKQIDFEASTKSPNPEVESENISTSRGESPSATPGTDHKASLDEGSDDGCPSPAKPLETAAGVEKSPGASVEMPPNLESGNKSLEGSPEVTKDIDSEVIEKSPNPEMESETTAPSAGGATSATGTGGESLHDVSDGPYPSPPPLEMSPGPPAEMPPALESGNSYPTDSPEASGDMAKEIDFEGLKKSNPDMETETTATSTGEAPSATGTDGAFDEQFHLPSPSPTSPLETPAAAAEVEMPPAVRESGNAYPGGSHEVPENISKEINFDAPKKSPNPDMEGETTPTSTDETTAPVTGGPRGADTPGEEESSKGLGVGSFNEALLEEPEMEKEEPKKPVSLKEAITKDTEQEKESKATISPGGLMTHQKDEFDVWTCKECGWKYPNAKPSPKIRKHHKKKCPGNSSARSGGVVDGGTSDEGTDNEHLSATEKATPAVTEAKADEPASVDGSKIASRDFSYSAAVQSSHAEPTTPDAGAPVTEKEEESTKSSKAETAVGGLIPHQKDDGDMWVCRDCGWRYPNAKPSPKVRKHHKKKCPGKGGVSKSKDGGSSDDVSSDDDKAMGGKCFPCFPA